MKKYLFILTAVCATLFIGYNISGIKATVAHNLAGQFKTFESDNQVSLLVMVNPFTKPDVLIRVNAIHEGTNNSYSMLYNNNVLDMPIHKTFTKKVNGKTYQQHYTLLSKKRIMLINELAKDKVTNLTIKIGDKFIDDLAGGEQIMKVAAFAIHISTNKNNSY